MLSSSVRAMRYELALSGLVSTLSLVISIGALYPILTHPGIPFYSDEVYYKPASSYFGPILYTWLDGSGLTFPNSLPLAAIITPLLTVLGQEYGVKMFLVLMLWVLGLATYIALRKLFDLLGVLDFKLRILASIIGAIFYQLSNLFIPLKIAGVPDFYWVSLTLPVAFAYLTSYLGEGKTKHLLVLGLCFFLSIPRPLGLHYFLLPLIPACMVISHKNASAVVMFKRLVLVVLTSIGVTAFFFVPVAAGYLLKAGGWIETYGGSAFRSVVLGSSHFDMRDILAYGSQVVYWRMWGLERNSNVLSPLGVIVSILAFCCPLVAKSSNERKSILCIVGAGLIAIFASKGINDPLGFLYFQIGDTLPLGLGALVRYPLTFLVLVAFVYAVLVSLSICNLHRRLKGRKKIARHTVTIVLMLIVFLPLTNATALYLKGHIWDEFNPTYIPKAYDEVNNWLNEQEGNFMVMWLPSVLTSKGGGRILTWKASFVAAFPEMYSKVAPVYGPIPSLLMETGRLDEILRVLGVKYVIYNDDIPLARYFSGDIDILRIVMNQQDLVLAKEFTDELVKILVFENTKYDGQIYSPTKVLSPSIEWVPGISGYAVRFDSSGCIKVPDSSSLDITDDLTIETWVMVSQLRQIDANILQKGGTTKENYKLLISHDGAISGGFSVGGRDYKSVSTSNVIEPGKWYHVAFVYGSGYARIYVNGTLSVSAENFYYKLFVNDEPLWIGNDEPPRERSFIGIMDELRVYNRALSAEEIRNNMLNLTHPLRDGLVLWLRMDEESGNLLKDYSGHGNDGTLIKLSARAPDLLLRYLNESWFDTGEYVIVETNENLNINNVTEHAKLITSKQISPVEWEITVDSEGPFFIVFTEQYDGAWKAYANGEECKHFEAYWYGNSFYVEKSGLIKIRIYHKLQDFLCTGYTITTLTFLLLLLHMAMHKKVERYVVRYKSPQKRATLSRLLNIVIRRSYFLRLISGKGIGTISIVRKSLSFLSRIMFANRYTKVHGYRLYLDSRDAFFSFFLAAFGSHEELQTKLFTKIVKEGDTVVDIGAGVGYYTLLAAKLAGKQAKIYAFEPEPQTYELLVKNIKLNQLDGIVYPIQKAVSDKCGTVKFFLNSECPAWSTILETKREFIEVETTTLDVFFKDKNIQIDVIKVDVEGAEMLVLSGMDAIIKKNLDLKMFIEFSPKRISRSGVSPRQFLGKLKGYGFSVFILDERAQHLNKIEDLSSGEAIVPCGKESVNLFCEKTKNG